MRHLVHKTHKSGTPDKCTAMFGYGQGRLGRRSPGKPLHRMPPTVDSCSETFLGQGVPLSRS